MAKRAGKAQSKAPKPKKPPKPKAPTPPPGPEPSRNGHPLPTLWEGDKPPVGRCAFGIPIEEATWFLDPWIPSADLTMVVGRPTCGKSTFLAYLAGRAKRVVILPGEEEKTAVKLLPRLIANGVNLRNVLLLDERRFTLYHDRDQIADAVWNWGADLLLIDPIDDYLQDEFRENDPGMVRALLKCAQAIAVRTAAAVVVARHPGKAADNVMVGGRQWTAVPKSILELIRDPGPPVKRIIRAHKDSQGVDEPPHTYTLTGERGKPKVFALGPRITDQAADAAKLATDARERLKGTEARALLKQVLTEGEQEATWVLAQGRANGFGETTMYEAKHRLGIGNRRTGFGRESKCYWTPPAAWPDLDAPAVPEGAPEAV